MLYLFVVYVLNTDATNKQLPPQRKSDLWEKEQEQLIGTMITAATFQSLEDD